MSFYRYLFSLFQVRKISLSPEGNRLSTSQTLHKQNKQRTNSKFLLTQQRWRCVARTGEYNLNVTRGAVAQHQTRQIQKQSENPQTRSWFPNQQYTQGALRRHFLPKVSWPLLVRDVWHSWNLTSRILYIASSTLAYGRSATFGTRERRRLSA